MLEEKQIVASASEVKANDPHQTQRTKAEVVILEQPASKRFRFRYKCEGRSAGSIPGATSTSETKTYPTIQVQNYVGDAIVVVSCVTKDHPYKPHPHNLVGREGCGNGIFTLPIKNGDMRMVFNNLGIQCVKKNEIEKSLLARRQIHVDPFRTGFAHANQPGTIDLNVVRLCFQVFIPDGNEKLYRVPLRPIVSQPIYDKKSMSELVITKLSHSSALCNGGQEVILLCEKVVKEDIAIRFYEEETGGWEGFGEFQHSSVHKQVAISFRTPRYKTVDIIEPARVKMQLRRPSDGATSDSLDFEMLPVNGTMCDLNEIRRKRLKTSVESSLNILLPSPGQCDDKRLFQAKLYKDNFKKQLATPSPPPQTLTSPPQSITPQTFIQSQNIYQPHHLQGHQINQTPEYSYQVHHLQGHQINQMQKNSFHETNPFYTQNIQGHQYTNGAIHEPPATLRNRQETPKVFNEYSSQAQNHQMTSVIFNPPSSTAAAVQPQSFKHENQNSPYFNDFDLTNLSGDLTTMMSVVSDLDTYLKDAEDQKLL